MNVEFACRSIHYDQTTVSAREIQNLLLNCAPMTRNPYVFCVIGRGLEFSSRAELPKNAKINWKFGCYSSYITILELIQNYAILNLDCQTGFVVQTSNCFLDRSFACIRWEDSYNKTN